MRRPLTVLLLVAAGAITTLLLAGPFSPLGTGEATLMEANARLEAGINLYHRKAYPDAELELRRALRADPDDWKAPFYVGAVQIQRQRYGMAVPYLERALSINPEEPKILNALGVAYFKLGRLDMAQGYFRASLNLDPENANARGLMETMTRLQRRARLATEPGSS